MAIIVKGNLSEINADGVIVVEVPSLKKCSPERGDTAYLWFSETAGGGGLHGVGKVESVDPRRVGPRGTRGYELTVRITLRNRSLDGA